MATAIVMAMVTAKDRVAARRAGTAIRIGPRRQA
jgi:hypothetical protein